MLFIALILKLILKKTTGFESSGFPHSGSHSGGSHPGSGIGGTSFQSPAPGFPGKYAFFLKSLFSILFFFDLSKKGSSADSGSGFGAPGFGGQGQQSFGAQGNNFGQSGSTQCKSFTNLNNILTLLI